MPYQGHERRAHKIFRTRNREYHTHEGVCIAVRDIRSSVWLSEHDALGMAITTVDTSDYCPGRPLIFKSDQVTVRTSPVVEVYRPTRHTVEAYDLLGGLKTA